MKMVIMTRTARRWVAAIVVAVALPLTACAPNGGGPAGPEDRPSVVTSVYPFQFVAERIGGADVSVTNLTEPGVEPHDLELTPRQVGSLADAELVIYERGFQPAVDEAIAQNADDRAFDTTSVVPLEPVAAGGDPEAGHEQEEGHDHGGEGDLDPHVWLDPTKLSTIASAMADRLAALHPAGAERYRSNADRLKSDLRELDEEFRSGFTGCARTEFITSHTAFGYLAKRYGLVQIGISGLNPDAEPSPARIAEIQREARDHGVTTIFTETLVSPAVARAVAGDLGLRTDILDPIEGLTAESRGRDYFAIMRANLSALERANGCPRT
jgi:zinc transport system substrate-binding protein